MAAIPLPFKPPAQTSGALPAAFGASVTNRQPLSRGLLRIVTNDELLASEGTKDISEKLSEENISDLARYVRDRFDKAVRHRSMVGIDEALIKDMRAYNGQYSPEKLQEIARFGGSQVYSRLMAMKCRGATALLRNVYMNSDRPWTLEPTADPEIPDAIDMHVKQLIRAEVGKVNATGAIVDQGAIRDRMSSMYDAVKLAERRRADAEAVEAQRKIDDILEEGQFYEALSEFLSDLPVYKYAVIKGPIVRNVSTMNWGRGGKLTKKEEPKFFWERISPWDVWFSPGATSIDNTEVFERQRLSTLDLYNLKDLPGYRDDAIDRIIEKYEARGYQEWIQLFDFDRARLEGRNNVMDDSYINSVEFHGVILGKYLKEFNVPGATEDNKPYFVTCWMVENDIFKVMLNPSPRVRVPYFVTSFDKQPGSLFGNGIPQMASDLTDVINACLRSLVNNVSIASGPQVVIDEELVSPGQGDDLYPWKRWKFVGDPANGNRRPVEFFSPQDNSQQIVAVLDKFSTMLDDVSTIPRYLTGSGGTAGAGRTASGLSMLINNANKTLLNVADNIDSDVFSPVLHLLYDYVMLTDPTGFLRGDESIVVDGVRQASKQEQDLTRQLEFLNLVNNPSDLALLGAGERARILQKVADNIGMEVAIKIPEEGVVAPGALPGAPGGGPNPTGSQVAAPNPAMAAPGAGGVPGVIPAPQVSPVNTVTARTG